MARTNIDTSDLDDAKENITELEERLDSDIQAVVSQLSSTMHAKIMQQIDVVGLSNRNDTKPDQPDLFGSFDRETISPNKHWRITSDAPHALAHEEGADPHPITPDTAGAIAFIPENQGKYHYKFWGEGEYSEYVVFGGVMHPGAEGKNYILRAQRLWDQKAEDDLRSVTQRNIVSSGFKPSTQ